MYINVPTKFNKKDISYQGIIEKDEGKSYVLSTGDKNVLNIITNGYSCYVYTICDSYLLIIPRSNIEINKVDNFYFLNKIMEFEYILQNNPKKITEITLEDNLFCIISEHLSKTFNERWLKGDLSYLNPKDITYIINNSKSYLKAYKQPLMRYAKLLSDNENGVGLCKHIFSVNTLDNKKLLIYKNKNIGGYIIKYNHDKFI